ncbi:sensor histidine kinase [Oryzifoliimicrobium ureilyticus]|uniref:sensor histidine kinase n=1 Tax=Oryzifoliimicrobium ureilyticus TaxID=3113724 RepID=UPI003076564B
MSNALTSAGIGIIYQDASLSFIFAENLPSPFKANFAPGGRDTDLYGAEQANQLKERKTSLLASGAADNVQVELIVDGETRTYELKMQRVGTPDAYGVLSVISDVTETRHREKVLKSLLRELSHRSKNLLAIIQGIATQTARNTLSLDNFLVKFRGRLQSLSHSQDLITDSSWRGAYFFELAEKQFAPYWPENRSSPPIFGENAHLTPNAAVHLGLALHELIINSASYGAIAAGTGSISLDCRLVQATGKRTIEIVWMEKLDKIPEIHDLAETSFGKTVLERVVPSSVNGRSDFKIGDGRIEYHLSIPESEFELRTVASKL